MITRPDRLAAISDALDRGAAIDLDKIHAQLAIDLVQCGRKAAEEAAQRDEDADRQLMTELLGILNGG